MIKIVLTVYVGVIFYCDLGIGKSDLSYITKDNSLGLNYIFNKEALDEWVKSSKMKISGEK
ncbi:hypothetical protein [Clostridium cellulovorans]|uniref:Uncharacterized protein n=1 Tax=Clostridium cellulovorans (strain ATCC 35296 / DSM 3052 / OCM 3 / 743B) TaxID=573061 RepID=D9SRY3_CLOC7|nr:hypothetical protein [Clostridium cellulovorans]ADL50500.1 hypothetical protein Clocel_0729 [Clostridium cellulovorans 743B]